MPTVEALRLIKIKATTEGVSEAAAGALKLEQGLAGVATVSERTTRTTVGLDRQLDTLRKGIDGNYRATVQYERGLATLDRALNTGRISAAAHGRDLDLLALKYRTANDNAGKFGQGLSRMNALATGALAGFAASITSRISVTAIQDATKSVADMNDAAQRIGIGTSELQKLQYAADQSGASIENVQEGLLKFARNISEAARGNGDLAKIMAANGVALKNQDGSLKSTNELLGIYADLLKNAKNPQDQVNLAAIAFGKSAGPALILTLQDGSAALRRMGDEASAAGVVLGEDLVKKAAALDDQFAKLNLQLGSAFKEFSITAAPLVVRGLQEIKQFLDEINAAGLAWKNGDYFGAFKPLLGGDAKLFDPQTYSQSAESRAANAAREAEMREQKWRRDLDLGIGGPGRSPSGPYRAPIAPQMPGGPDEAARARDFGRLPQPIDAVPRGPTILPPGTDPDKAATKKVSDEDRGENAFARALAEQDRRNKSLLLEADSLGQSAAQRERGQTILDLEAKAIEANRLAKRADIAVTDEQRVAILAMADATAIATQRLQEAKEAERERISQMDDVRSATKGMFSDIAHGLAEGKSGKEIGKALLSKIAGEMIDSGAQGFTDALFDKQGKPGGGLIGGAVSSLLGERGASPANPVYVTMGGLGGLPGLTPPGAVSGSGSITSAPLAGVGGQTYPNGGGPGNAFVGAVAAGGGAAAMTGPLMSGGKLNPGAAFAYLRSKGMSDAQAAVALGTFRQESGFDPSNINRKEGAYGLYQTRLERRSGLEAFAAKRGVPASDPQAQMDNMLREMRTTEAGPGSAFLSSTDLAGANSAMKRFIRYGDDSQGTRLGYARGYMNQFGGGQQPINPLATTQLDQTALSLNKVAASAAAVPPSLTDVSKGFSGLGDTLGGLGAMIGGKAGAGGSLAGGIIGKLLGSILGAIPGFAEGTDFAPGGAAWVGERGRELVNLPRGSQVVPNRALMASPRAAARPSSNFTFNHTGAPININVAGDVSEKNLAVIRAEVARSRAQADADLERNLPAMFQHSSKLFG